MEEQIVFINQSSGYLMVDIVNAFRGEYRKRVLFTGFLNPRGQQLDADVKVEKLVQYNRSSGSRRMITWVLAFLRSAWLLLTKYRKAELFLVSNPPLNIFLPLIVGNRYSLLIYDIYPDALVAQKFFREDSMVIRFWQRVNRKVMARARKVYTISEGMKKVISAYVPEDKIEVVPVWSDGGFLQRIPRTGNAFIRENGFDKDFLVMYSGNLGNTHKVEAIVDIAERTGRENIKFVIIGEGDKKEMLKERIRTKARTNCIMLPWQETSMLSHSLSAADIAIVTLGKEGSNHSIPSKLFSLMSVGAPVLCIADPGSDLAKLLARYQMGECFDEDDIEGMVRFIELLASDAELRERMGANALKASLDFTSDNALKFVNTK